MAKTILFALTALLMLASSQGKHSVVAPGPTPAPMNLTAILEKGRQYTTLMRLLKETQIGEQIQNQLNNSLQGMTMFAPTDNAFNNLKPGTLNSLTAQEQVALVLYHVLPRYYSLTTFETTSNPVSTQASDKSGPYTLNITSTSHQVNVSTGVDETQINNDLYSDFPLAVYSVDNVLLPNEIFGAKPPAAAPAPSSAPKKEKPGKIPVGKKPAADEEESSTSSTKSGASYMKGKGMGWGGVVGIGLVCVGSLF